MKIAQLEQLGRSALAWASAYATLKNALIKQGIPPEEASQVAKDTTNMAALWDSGSGEPCPLCGRGE